jgi:hypothetical protein
MTAVAVLGTIPAVKQFATQLWHGEVGAAAETGLWTVAGFHPVTMPLVGAKGVANEYERHREEIDERAACFGEANDPGMIFGVRTPIGGVSAAGYAVGESTARLGISVIEASGEGAKILAEPFHIIPREVVPPPAMLSYAYRMGLRL